MKPPARLRGLVKITLKASVLLAAGVLSAITAMRIAVQGREVRMPNVIGIKAGEAQAALEGRGLGMKIDDRVYSNLPVDFVVRQSPPSGVLVKTTQRAHVVLSLGPQRISIPAVVGKSLRAARLELLRAGLQLGAVSAVSLPDQEPDLILQQSPPPRAANAGGPRVNLLVALRPPPPVYLMPDLTGLTLAELPERLSAAGLKLARVHLLPSVELPRGRVLSHLPARGARVAPGDAVEVWVVE